MRLKKIMALGMVMAVFTTGCQKAPEDAAVKEKNLDKMIEQAQDTKETGEALENMAEKYTTYKNSFANEKLGVKVNVDAKVEIPKTDQMSVVRVEQKKIDQSFLDKVKKALNLNQTFYDGWATNVRTKSMIESEIRDWKQAIKEMSQKDENGETVDVEEYEGYVKELNKEYEKAPDSIDWSKYLSDGKIMPVKTLYEKYKNETFYKGQYELNKNGDVYYAVTNEKDKNNIHLYAQNNENYGNCFRYFRSKNGCTDSFASTAVGGLDTNYGMWPADKTPTVNDTAIAPDAIDGFYEYKNEPTTISKEKANKTAENFLKDIGLTDFQLNNSGLYCEALGVDDNKKCGYRKVWRLQYLRNLNGVLVNNESGSKHTEGHQGSDYVKKDWPGESIDIYINDSGIVTFLYNAPIEKSETVVEKAKLISFEKIKKTFEKMIVTVNAQNQEDKEEVAITVDKVILRYMRISEKDSFDTGLLVPVWEFLGKAKYKIDTYGNNTTDVSLLTINAIDSSVINMSLGY